MRGAKALERIKAGYQFKRLRQDGVLALFTSGRKNFSFGRENFEPLRINRRSFLKQVGINFKDLVCLQQVHSSGVVCVGEDERGKGAQQGESAISGADAVITDVRNLPLAIFIADCLAIYFFDSRKRIIGLAHAGWRPTAEKICLKVIKMLRQHFGSQSESLVVAFSPAIRSCCYEVDLKVSKFFKHSLIRRGDRLFLDLAKENKIQLLEMGVKEKNIIDCGICTACSQKEFFSYRREGLKAGRMMAVMMIK